MIKLISKTDFQHLLTTYSCWPLNAQTREHSVYLVISVDRLAETPTTVFLQIVCDSRHQEQGTVVRVLERFCMDGWSSDF